MAEFLVKVADERGRMLQQVENGYSEAEVRERFVQQGYLVYWIKPKGLLTGGKIRRRKRVKASTFLVFNQQFLTLIRAGLPILSAVGEIGRIERRLTIGVAGEGSLHVLEVPLGGVGRHRPLVGSS